MRKTFIGCLTLLALLISGCTSSGRRSGGGTSGNPTSATAAVTSNEISSSVSQSTGELSSSQISVQTSEVTSSATSVVTSVSISNITSSISSAQSSTDTSATSGLPVELVTKVIDTSGADYYSKAGFQQGEQVDDASYPDKVEKFKTYLLGEIENSDFLTLLKCTMLNHSKMEEKQLQFGSQTTAGKIEWTSAVPMKSVEVSLCNYYNKYTDYQTGLMSYHPESTQFYVGDSILDIEAGSADVMPETKTIRYEPEEAFTKFTMGTNRKYVDEDAKQFSRAYVYSITITWQL